MNGFNLLEASDIKLGGSTITALYYGSIKLWPTTSIDYSKEYFTIESLTDSNTITFSKYGSAPTTTIRWSSDKITWNSISPSSSGTTLKTLNKNEKIYIKGSNNQYASSSSAYNYFSSTGDFNVYGNIMSLIYGDSFIGQTTLSYTHTFYEIFYSSNIVDASNLILPATTLTSSCYAYMFYGCKSLTTAPELPATTLAQSCYSSMFWDCTSLTTAPSVLPATTLAQYCYYYMFNNCPSLTTTPELPATTLANYCYEHMFYGCTSLTTPPELPATTLTTECYKEMFYGCTSLTTAPELPATKLAVACYQDMFCGCTSLTTAPELPAPTLLPWCYYHMFYGCTSLTTPPELPATTLTNYCYGNMFNGCTKLNSIKCLATDISATNCTQNWVYNVAKKGTFYKSSSMTGWTTGISGIPSGWTVKTASS